MSNRYLRLTLIAMFVLSGFASLTYQVVWQRVLTQVIGVDAYSVTLIVAIFMLGLGLGGLWGTRWLKRHVNVVLIYAGIEAMLAVFGFVSVDLIRMVNAVFAPLSPGLPLDFAVNFGLLVIPTVLMGATLPLMVHLVRNLYLPGEALGTMYSANVLGAALGCLTTGFVLVGTYGLVDTSRITASVNALVAASSLMLLKNSPVAAPIEVTRPAASPTAARKRGLLWISAFIAGFAALSYEIVFFRIFTAYFGMVSYVFPLVLFSYLVCMAWGNKVFGRLSERRPAPMLVSWAVLFSVLSTTLILLVPEFLHWVGINQERLELERSRGAGTSLAAVKSTLLAFLTPDARKHWGLTYEQLGVEQLAGIDPTTQIIVIVSLSLVLMLPIRFVSGLFPILVRAYTRDRSMVGVNTGTTYFVQTMGNTSGALVTGLFLLPWLGTIDTLRLLGLSLALLPALLWLAEREGESSLMGRSQVLVVAAITALGVLGYPARFYHSIRDYYDSYRLGLPEPITPEVVVENAVTVTLAYPIPAGYWISMGRERSTPLVSAADAWEIWPLEGVVALVPQAKRALIVGIGPGTHLPVLERLYPGIEIDVVELNPALIDLLKEKSEPTLADSINRARIHITDGRRFILKNPRLKYDIIQIGVNHATTSGAGNLFTRELMRVLRYSLTPDGVLTLNAYAPAVSGLLEVFRNVAVLSPGAGSRAGEIARSLHAAGSGARVAHVIAWNRDDASAFRERILHRSAATPSLLPVSSHGAPVTVRPHRTTGCILFRDAIEPLLAVVRPATDDLPSTEYFLTQRQNILGVSPTHEARYWGSPAGCVPLREIWP